MSFSLPYIIKTIQEAVHITEELSPSVIEGQNNTTKKDLSPVTIADFLVQALFAQRFSSTTLIAEETREQLAQDPKLVHALTENHKKLVGPIDAEQLITLFPESTPTPPASFWTLDPIDGTKGYLRGAQYAIALAKIHNHSVEEAFLACPRLVDPASKNQGLILHAQKGKGCSLYDLKTGSLLRNHLQCSSKSEGSQAILTGSVESAHTDPKKVQQFQDQLGIDPDNFLKMDSQAKYAAVSLGIADILIRLPNPHTPDYREKIWDHAAGSLIVTESGGSVSDAEGKVLDFSHGIALKSNSGVVATNGPLHQQVLNAIGVFS